MSDITLTIITKSAGTSACDAAAVTVQPIRDAAGTAAWARYVEQAPEASVFHHPEWCAAVETVFGHTPLHWLALRKGAPVGVLPVMEVRSLLAGRLQVSVPYGTYGGVLADDEAVTTALAGAAAAAARERGARVLDLRSANASVPGFEAVEGYLGFVRQLPLHPNDVPGFLPKRARAAARHARDRDGVVVQHAPALSRTVWELYCRSMRRIGSINYPYKFFAELVRRFGERAWVTVAFAGTRPVAGTMSLVFRDTVMPYGLGADERVRCDGAANLLYWSVMERAVRSGLHWFDYGRSRAGNVGAVGFKRNQGFEPRPLGYQRYVPPGQRPPDLRPSNPRFALARRVWRALPLPASRALGSYLARSIPG